MALLSEPIFRDKLDKLNTSQQSIEQTAAWCLFHRADARRVAEVWEAYFSKADQPKRLAMVYLANDIVQNGRKRGTEFLAEFYKVLPRALRHVLAKGDDKTRAAVNKVIRVWDERKVFGSTGSKTFHELVHGAEMVTSPREARSGSQGQPPSEQQQQAAAALAGPAPLAAALQQASAAAQQTMQLHGAVAAAVPLALGPAAGVQQVAAAHSAVQGLCAALRQEVGSRQAAAGHLRQLLAEQEGGAAQAAAQLQQASQQLAQLDAKLAQAQASAQAAAGMQQQQPAQQQAAAPWGGAPPAAAQPMQTQEGGEAPAAATSEEAAQLAAALARDRNSAEALLAAFMALPQDQQEGLGAELAGFLQPEAAVGAAAEMEGGDDLYDPEDL